MWQRRRPPLRCMVVEPCLLIRLGLSILTYRSAARDSNGPVADCNRVQNNP